MKVLIIGHHFVTANNQRRIEELSKFKDIDITLLTPKWWNEESRKVYLEKDYDKDYAIYSGQTLFTGHNAFSFYITSLFKLLWRIKPDIIDIYEEPWGLTTLQTILFKKVFLRKSKIMFYSAQNINKKYPFPFNWIERFTFKNAEYCYPCSQGVVEVLHAKGYKNKIKVVPLGLDIESNIKMKEDNAFTIGYVGRFVKEKGILDLLDAVSSLDGNFKLLLVGDGPLKSWIYNRAENKGFKERIEFAGSIPRNKMPQYYAKMDVLAVPSRTIKRWKEQFGRIITEAFAYGVPVVGSDSGSIPEVLAGCGLIFKEGDVKDLKEKIISLRDNKKLRDELIEKGKGYAQDNYTWSKAASMVHKIYRELIEKKKVLFLDHMSKPSGGEIYLLDVLSNINKEKYDIKVLLGKDGYLAKRLKKSSIDVDILELPEEIIEMRKESFNSPSFESLFGLIKYIFKIKNYISENRIDIVYTNSIKSDIYGSLASKLAQRPCIWHLHDRINPDYLPEQLCNLLIFISKYFVAKVICNSKTTKEAFVDAGGQKDKAVVVLNGVDFEKFSHSRSNGQLKKIVMVGRIAPWKGQKVFIQAANEIIKKRKDVNFYIAGSVLFGEDDYKKEIEGLVSENGLRDNLKFLDFIEDIPSFLSDVDILVHASILPEPFGLSVAEAMASGLPVVASRAGGILEMIEDEENGLLYEPGNYKELAEDILRVLDDKVLTLKLGNNAKETISNRFNIKTSVKNIEKVLEAV